MNKTVNINLGGIFFHIDEDAYQKLNRYFDAIRSSLSADGKDEIMKDIEDRIAELLSEKIKTDRQVVSIKEVEGVIEVMGQPEDYRLDDDEPAQKNYDYYTPNYNPSRSKKLYRDDEKGLIAGVCAGLSHYLRINAIWVRILFIVSPFITFGTSVLIYLILWVLIPKAITTTEKLEMKGEPINISNIERKVREEFGVFSEKFQNVNYNRITNGAKNGADRVGNGLRRILMAFFKVFTKLIGGIIATIAIAGIIGVIILFFMMLFTTSVKGPFWFLYAEGLNYTDIPIWVAAVLMLLATAIPLFTLFILGLKILVENLRSIGIFTKYSLLAVWLVAIGGLIYIGIAQANEVSAEGKTVLRNEITMMPSDTLNLKFKFNNYYTKSLENQDSYRITQDSEGNNIIYSNDIRLYIMKTEELMPYIQIEKISLGRTISEARNRAEVVNYNFEIEGNNIILDNYYITDIENKYRNQHVRLYLFIPEGMYLKPDDSVIHYDSTSNSYFNLKIDAEHLYQMSKHKVNCITCTEPNLEEKLLEQESLQTTDSINNKSEVIENINQNNRAI